jgi:hypothetical protein
MNGESIAIDVASLQSRNHTRYNGIKDILSRTRTVRLSVGGEHQLHRPSRRRIDDPLLKTFGERRERAIVWRDPQRSAQSRHKVTQRHIHRRPTNNGRTCASATPVL